MTKILEATYTNGNLILREPLNPNLEGKNIRLLIIETTEIVEKLTKEEKRSRFLENAKHFSFKLPKNYNFNRDEIYDR